MSTTVATSTHQPSSAFDMPLHSSASLDSIMSCSTTSSSNSSSTSLINNKHNPSSTHSYSYPIPIQDSRQRQQPSQPFSACLPSPSSHSYQQSGFSNLEIKNIQERLSSRGQHVNDGSVGQDTFMQDGDCTGMMTDSKIEQESQMGECTKREMQTNTSAMSFMDNLNLVAEAARRAQMACLMRDLGDVEIS